MYSPVDEFMGISGTANIDGVTYNVMVETVGLSTGTYPIKSIAQAGAGEAYAMFSVAGASGTYMGMYNSLSGQVTVTSTSPNLIGTFNMTAQNQADNTSVTITNGTFNVQANNMDT